MVSSTTVPLDAREGWEHMRKPKTQMTYLHKHHSANPKPQ